MSLQNRWYQVSKCSFLMVLLLAFPVLQAAPAYGDVPPPNTDCTGATVTPEEYLELVARMGAVAGAYETLFTSYAWCDELPLYIAGVPETCMPSEGWRNYWGDAEGFTLEPLYVHTLDVDGLLQYTQLEPDTEALLRARDFRIGAMGAVVSTNEGTVGLWGGLRSFSDAAGTVWTYWYVQGTLSFQEVVDLRNTLGCTQAMVCLGDPQPRNCKAEYNTCAGEARDARDQAIDNADSHFNGCVVRQVGLCVAYVACLVGCSFTGPLAPWCTLGCAAPAGGCVEPSFTCVPDYNFRVNNAARQYDKDLKDCLDDFKKCKDAVAGTGGGTGGAGTGAPPAHAQE